MSQEGGSRKAALRRQIALWDAMRCREEGQNPCEATSFLSRGRRGQLPGSDDAVRRVWFRCWLIHVLFKHTKLGPRGNRGAKLLVASHAAVPGAAGAVRGEMPAWPCAPRPSSFFFAYFTQLLQGFSPCSWVTTEESQGLFSITQTLGWGETRGNPEASSKPVIDVIFSVTVPERVSLMVFFEGLGLAWQVACLK